MPGNGTGSYLAIGGLGLPPLVHDMYFNLPDFQIAWAINWTSSGGVVWNTTFESTDYGSSVYGSDSGSFKIQSGVPWNSPSTMGALDVNGDKNLYIEDSIFKFVGQSPDVDDNGRLVLRNSQFIGSSGLTHGSTGATGGRHVEIYDNTITYPNINRAISRYFWFRAGTAVITGNSIDDITGQGYGDKSEFVFAVENAKRGGQFGCATTYPAFHQVGSGHNGVSQVSDPVYIWGNTGGAIGKLNFVGLNDGDPDTCNTGLSTADFFQQNRDYFVNAGAKPGWSRYTYPHPLRTGTTSPPPTAYILTASAGTGGTISPAGTVSVNSGSSQTFTITPNTGYSIQSVTVNGVSQGAISTYTFSNITSNQTISATFTANLPVPGDFNLDHVVNTLDFSLLNSKWLQNYPAYDLYVDGIINSLDFAIFSSNWGKVW